MGIYIKGMKMPKSCYKCDMKRKDGMDIVCPIVHEQFSVTDVNILEYRLDSCPLIPVPLHGRCIDADKLVRENYGQYGAIDTLALEVIKAAPTIIPAEEGET